jgi:hypothetical protein
MLKGFLVMMSRCLSTAMVLGLLTGSAWAQDKIGVEACDTFITKYEACMKDKAGAQRAQFDQMITQMRTSWKQMADNPQTKPMLDQNCRQMIDTVKASLNTAPYSCGF